MPGKQEFPWGDHGQDDETLDAVLPPPQIIGPNEKGIIEWRENEDGSLATRRGVGDSVAQIASDNLTLVSTQDIFLEATRAAGGAAAASKQEGESSELARLGNTSLIVCDIPGCVTSGKTSYVAPHMRSGADKRSGDSMFRGRDANSIRVRNLSKNTREQDLLQLFRPFGPINRTYVAFDRETGLSKHFGFVNFVKRKDAIRAINKLEGYVYDNLILRLDWATRRSDRS